MPLLLFLALAIVAGGALLFAGSSLGPFLEARRFHGASATPIVKLAKGTVVTVRGAIVAARREAPYPRITPGDTVFSELQVLEQVGNRVNVALRSKNAQLFTIEDADGSRIDVDPEGAEIVESHTTSAKASQAPDAVLAYINKAGSYAWQNTPATCHESALRVGDVVTLHGRVILPLPGQMREKDSELRIMAKQVSLHLANPWSSTNGRTLLISLLVAAVTMPAAVVCAIWAGFL
jgi:hypothetical protein